jgi:hypothetical protein
MVGISRKDVLQVDDKSIRVRMFRRGACQSNVHLGTSHKYLNIQYEESLTLMVELAFRSRNL